MVNNDNIYVALNKSHSLKPGELFKSKSLLLTLSEIA